MEGSRGEQSFEKFQLNRSVFRKVDLLYQMLFSLRKVCIYLDVDSIVCSQTRDILEPSTSLVLKDSLSTRPLK